MSFDDLVRQGQTIPADQLDDAIRLLMRDPRFPALAFLIRSEREQLAVEVSSREVAAAPSATSVLAHAAGGIDSLLTLEMKLTEISAREEKP